MRSKNFFTGAAVATLIVIASTPAMGQEASEMANEGQPDIVETAVAAGSFGTLATALEAAGLVETLKGDGPFTVFAPTDDAFAKLPEGTVEDLLKPENKDQLTAILTYHVVPGKLMASEVASMDAATTVEGSPVSFSVSEDGAMIENARILQTDIETSNGVIHVIDTVILPQG